MQLSLFPEPPPFGATLCGGALTSGPPPAPFLHPFSLSTLHLFFHPDFTSRCPPSPVRDTQHDVPVTRTTHDTLLVHSTSMDSLPFHI